MVAELTQKEQQEKIDLAKSREVLPTKEQVVTPELPPTPEKSIEGVGLDRALPTIDEGGGSSEQAAAPLITPVNPVTEAEVKAIEHVMEDGLADLYMKMPTDSQAKFRQLGEQTARQINVLLHESKLQIKKIVKLLIEWLKVIPGVNRFFLEQEAKIKTDELLRLYKK
ncbi:MAG: hypothetical protein WCK11_03125 [Candidatus Falkowbacteria bacterium]